MSRIVGIAVIRGAPSFAQQLYEPQESAGNLGFLPEGFRSDDASLIATRDMSEEVPSLSHKHSRVGGWEESTCPAIPS